MHSLLETYLAEVAAQLSALPAKQRTEEVREMRAHLENAVIVNRELGQSEDEAAQNAVAQFGTPEAVGHSTVEAWRRGESLRKRDFWGITVCTLALSQVPHLLTPLVLPPINHYLSSRPSVPLIWLWLALLGCYACLYALLGGISGVVFPRQAVKGAAVGTALGAGYLCLLWIKHIQIAMQHTHGAVNYTADLNGLVALAATLLFAVLGAWTGSRWRKARTGRARLARG